MGNNISGNVNISAFTILIRMWQGDPWLQPRGGIATHPQAHDTLAILLSRVRVNFLQGAS
ncbi:MAG TPA: hypothetical protein VFV38_51385 [Ktedonobacteraceae bacterium]|nr:hypothetical protein [Ktedonobacteraceae bacterium]